MTVRSIKKFVALMEDGALALLFCPHPGGFDSSRVPTPGNLLPKAKKIAAYLVSISQLLCLAFLYGWHFLNKISLDWPLTLTTSAVYFKTF